MRGKALLMFLITAALTVVAYAMYHNNHGEIGLAPALTLGAVALLSLSVAVFGKPAVNANQRERDRMGLGDLCTACGRSGTHHDPLTLSNLGYRVHLSHINDPSSGLYGQGRR